MDPLRGLRDELRAQQAPVSRGVFSIDPIKAREKLERFRVADPRRYVLSLVQAAQARGATRIDIALDARDMRMRFDGPPFALAELDDLQEALYVAPRSAEERARKRLSLGLHTAQALSPASIEVQSGAAALAVGPSGEHRVRALPEQEAVEGTEVRIRERFGTDLAIRFCRDVIGELAERRHLREACAGSETSIYVDGEDIARGLVLAQAAKWQRLVRRSGIAAVVGFGEEPEPRAELYLDGVRVEVIDGWCDVPHAAASVRCDEFALDVSERSVVRDRAFDAALDALHEALYEALKKLARHAMREETGLPADAITLRWLTALGRPELVWNTALAALPIFVHGADGRTRLSLEQVDAFRQRTGQVPTCGQALLWLEGRSHGLAQEALREEVLVLAGEVERDALRRIFGRVDGDTRFRFRARRRRNLARFRAQRSDVRLSEAERYHLVRVPIEAPGVRGELAVESVRHRRGRARLVKNGHLLWQRVIAGPVRGVAFVVEADFTPREDYSGAEIDDVYLGALAAVAAALRAAFEQVTRDYAALCRRLSGEERELLHRFLVEYLALAHESDGVARLVGSYAGATDRAMLEQWVARLGADRALRVELGLHASSGAAHPVVELPLLLTVDGKRRSLREVAELARACPVPCVTGEHAGPPAGALRLDEAGVDLLKRLLGGDRVLDLSSETQSVLRELAQMHAQVPPPARPASRASTAAAEEEALVRALHDALVWLRVRHADHVESLTLDSIALASDDGGAVVEVDARGIRLQRHHPLVQRCLRAVDDPVAIGVLASVVCSAINARWAEITDDDERAFHDDLIERLCDDAKDVRSHSA